jgi:hypothetical protein
VGRHSPLRPSPLSDEPYLAYLLSLAGITRIRLTNTDTSPSTNNTAIGTGTSDDSSHPLPRVTVMYSPPDAQSPPAPDIVQDFKAAAIRLLERFAQGTSQSTRKGESWARIAHVVDERNRIRQLRLRTPLFLRSARNMRINSVSASFFCHISPFIWFVCIRGMLVGGLRKRRGREEALTRVYCLESK